MSSNTPVSSRIIRYSFFVLLLFIAVAVIYSVKVLAIPLAVSILLAFLFQPLVNLIEARGINRLLVITLIFAVTGGLVAVAAFFVVPGLVSEGRNLAKNLPQYDNFLQKSLGSLRDVVAAKFPAVTVPDFYQLIKDKLAGSTGAILKSIPAIAGNLLYIVSLLTLIPVFTFFFLADGYLIKKAMLRLTPNRYFEMFVLLFSRIADSVQCFIRGQLIDALAVGILTSIGLSLIGLPYSIVIGIIAGLGNLIPYLGPVIGFVPAFFVLIVSPEGLSVIGFVKIAVVFVIVQFLEGTFVYPIAVGKSVNLHPLVVIVGVATGGQLAGVIGMILVIPVISIVKVTVEVVFFYLRRYSIL
ncbi:MAG: AI-2E family transporter [Fibrobacter sp.]|nr:AI-2E family transporter [Fibrobacter sp.]